MIPSFFFLNGTVQQKGVDRKCFYVEKINHYNRFYIKDHVCFKQTDTSKQFKFSNIGKHILISSYVLQGYNLSIKSNAISLTYTVNSTMKS